MRFGILVALAILASAIFFSIGYALDIRRASQITPKFVYIDIIYFFGSFFYLIFAALTLYQTIKFPQSNQSLSSTVGIQGLFFRST